MCVAGAGSRFRNGVAGLGLGSESKIDNSSVACRASHFIKLRCQTFFLSVFLYFFVCLLSSAQHLAPAVVCNSRFAARAVY